MRVYPAILTESIDILREQLSQVSELSELLPTVHIDIIDGEFVDNLTLSPIDLIGTDFGSESIDFHLMVNDPENYIYECKQVDNAKRIIAQVEHLHSQADFIQEVKEYDLRPGLALDMYTPLDAIDDASWSEIEVLLLMGVKAGEQGQAFKGGMILNKLKEAVMMKKKRDLPHLEILIDGGVTTANSDSIAHSGATSVAVGSTLWNSRDFEQTVRQILG